MSFRSSVVLIKCRSIKYHLINCRSFFNSINKLFKFIDTVKYSTTVDPITGSPSKKQQNKSKVWILFDYNRSIRYSFILII